MTFFAGLRSSLANWLRPPTKSPFRALDDFFGSGTTPIGEKYTQDDLIGMLEESSQGRHARVQTFFDEMVSRDAMLKALIDLQGDYLVGASFSMQAWPERLRRGDEAKKPEATRAREIRDYLWNELSRPDVGLDQTVRTLWSAFPRGISGLEVKVDPAGGPKVGGKRLERLLSLKEIPAALWAHDIATGEPLVDQDGTGSELKPVSELGSSVVCFETDLSFRNPARRGLLRPLFNLWLIRNLGFQWWSRFVELYGTPFRLATVPGENVQALAVARRLLAEAGNAGYAAVPEGVDFRVIDTFQRISGHSPHQIISEYAGREYSKLICGHAHAIEVQQGTGSVQGSKHGDQILIRKTNARGIAIAGVLRAQWAFPAVARNFGIDDALEFTPSLDLFMEQLADMLQVAQAIQTGVETGVETIPVEEWHQATGIRQAVPGEPVIEAIPSPGQPTKAAVKGKASKSSKKAGEGAKGAPGGAGGNADQGQDDEEQVLEEAA